MERTAEGDQVNAIGGQTRRLLVIGFGGLLFLLAFTGLNAISVLSKIETRNESIRADYLNRQQLLDRVRADLYLSGTYVRDLLLEPDPTRADSHRRELDSTTHEVRELMARYKQIVRPEENQPFESFAREVSIYFDSLLPALQWDSSERSRFGYTFMQKSLLPRRMVIVRLADEISRFNERQLESGNQQVSSLFRNFRLSLIVLFFLTLVIGLLLAAISFFRIIKLEELSTQRFNEVLRARTSLRELSARIVEVQESERRSLSRELHDEVGQVVSALLLGIGNVSAAIAANEMDAAKEQLDDIRRAAERTVAVVRDMSLVLRPSMLDDLGLIPALEWQAREVSRNNKVQVSVESNVLDEVELPDEQRTCVYRVVQEALRNIVRHAKAKTTRIFLNCDSDTLRLVITDDGQGFISNRQRGVGLLGMEERVRHLQGRFQLQSKPGEGTTISVELPVAAMRHG